MTHGDNIVADATHTVLFTDADPWPTVLARLAVFSIAPADHQALVDLSTHPRPDLLVGRNVGGVLRLQALDVGLEPLSSRVIHRVVTTYCLDGCGRTRADGDPDRIDTPRALITGAMPSHVYHGTSDAHLPTIRTAGLSHTQPSNWPAGGRGHVYLAAEGQVAAFHARRTSAKDGGEPIVLKCALPDAWVVDHDVQHRMVANPAVPSNDPVFLSQEAGLFAVPAIIPWADILEVRRPVMHSRFDTWPTV